MTRSVGSPIQSRARPASPSSSHRLVRARKEAAATEVQQAEAFNSFLRALEQELDTVTRQRDNALAQISKLTKKRTSAVNYPHVEATSPLHGPTASTRHSESVSAPATHPHRVGAKPSGGTIMMRRVLSFDRNKGR